MRVAAASSGPEGFLSSASEQLGGPLVLLDLGGNPFAAAPPSAVLDPSVANLVTSTGEARWTTPGWRIVPIENARERLAFLAVGNATQQAEESGTLDLVESLLVDLLERAALARTVRSQRQASLTRRLVTDHTITPSTVRSEARASGLGLADSYWPNLLVWMAGHPGPRTLAEVDREARREVPGSLTVGLDNATVPVLYPAGASRGHTRQEVARRLARLVHRARRLGHCDVRGIADERSFGVASLPERVDRLEHLRRYLPMLAGDSPVVPARAFALDRLLNEGLNRRLARAYVQECLGPLLRHDVEHGTDLAQVLELALDFARREEASRASYRHRNTFRRHLAQALELTQANLDDPHDRLAVHIALKLRRLLAAGDDAHTNPRAGQGLAVSQRS